MHHLLLMVKEKITSATIQKLSEHDINLSMVIALLTVFIE